MYCCTNPPSSNNTLCRMFSRCRVNFAKVMQMYDFEHFRYSYYQHTEVVWTGNFVSWAWVWAFLVTTPSFKAAALSSVMFSWKEFCLMPRLKMCGILPPLLHVFMALRINSGTLSFANSVTFATFILIFVCFVSLHLWNIYLLSTSQVISQKIISFPLSVCGCMCTHTCL